MSNTRFFLMNFFRLVFFGIFTIMRTTQWRLQWWWCHTNTSSKHQIIYFLSPNLFVGLPLSVSLLLLSCFTCHRHEKGAESDSLTLLRSLASLTGERQCRRERREHCPKKIFKRAPGFRFNFAPRLGLHCSDFSRQSKGGGGGDR